MFAIIVSLVATPVAGAVGTAVYGARLQLYAEEAQTRHPGAAVLSGGNLPAARLIDDDGGRSDRSYG